MGNELKGEYFLTVDGTKYRLANTIDAMMAVEELFSTPDKKHEWDESLALVKKGNLEHVRALLWSFFQTYHPEVQLSDIGRLMHEAGGQDEILKIARKVLLLAEPDPKDMAAVGARNPQKAQARSRDRMTGERSTSAPVVSA